MGRARLLACVAAVATAAMLPSAASAQACAFLGSPQPFQPCIVMDNSKIVQIAKEIQEKTQELKLRQAEITQYMNIESAMGAIGKRGIPSLPSVPAIAPLAAKTFGQAGAEARAKISSGGLDTAGRNEMRKNTALDLRAAAGDGYAIALATKSRFAEMEQDAQSIATLTQKCSVDARSDWSFNTQARSLLLRALAARREIDAAQVQLMSARVMASPAVSAAGSLPSIPQAAPAVDAPPPPAPQWSDSIGKVANLTSYLASLITARDLLNGFKDSIKNHQDTQRDYQDVLANAQRLQNDMVRFAQNEGYKKGVDGSRLLAEADRIMGAVDHTTWDDPSRKSVANQAAKTAKRRLDDMVRGDVSDSWVSNLANRAEAFKQEAFYREFNTQAKSLEAESRAAIASLGGELQINMNDPKALEAAIAATQNSLGVVGREIDAAPPEIQAKRDAIYKSTMETAGYVAEPMPS